MRCVQNEKKEILNKSQKLFLDQSVSVAVVMMMMPTNAFEEIFCLTWKKEFFTINDASEKTL